MSSSRPSLESIIAQGTLQELPFGCGSMSLFLLWWCSSKRARCFRKLMWHRKYWLNVLLLSKIQRRISQSFPSFTNAFILREERAIMYMIPIWMYGDGAWMLLAGWLCQRKADTKLLYLCQSQRQGKGCQKTRWYECLMSRLFPSCVCFQ